MPVSCHISTRTGACGRCASSWAIAATPKQQARAAKALVRKNVRMATSRNLSTNANLVAFKTKVFRQSHRLRTSRPENFRSFHHRHLSRVPFQRLQPVQAGAGVERAKACLQFRAAALSGSSSKRGHPTAPRGVRRGLGKIAEVRSANAQRAKWRLMATPEHPSV